MDAVRIAHLYYLGRLCVFMVSLDPSLQIGIPNLSVVFGGAYGENWGQSCVLAVPTTPR
jgi:hypothetical protein